MNRYTTMFNHITKISDWIHESMEIFSSESKAPILFGSNYDQFRLLSLVPVAQI